MIVSIVDDKNINIINEDTLNQTESLTSPSRLTTVILEGLRLFANMIWQTADLLVRMFTTPERKSKPFDPFDHIYLMT